MNVWRPALLWAGIGMLLVSGLAGALAVGEGRDLLRTAGVTVPPCDQPQPLDIVLIIDRSGSMGNPAIDPPTIGGQFRIFWAKQAANALVEQLAGGDDDLSPHRLAVISYDGGDAGDGATFATVDLALGAGSSAAGAHAAIDGITPLGSTYIAPGLSEATSQLAASARPGVLQVAILLSDGRNFANSGEEPDTAERRANTITAIPALHALTDTVYAVGIGDEALTAPPAPGWAPLDVPLLEQIASDGPPGRYVNVEDAVKLPDLLGEILSEVEPCTPTPTSTPTSTNTPTFTPTNTPTSTFTPTNTPLPTDTPTVVPSSTPTDTPSPTATVTPTGTSTPPPPTGTPTQTSTPTLTATPTATPTPTDTPTAVPTSSPTSEVLGPSPSPSPPATPTATETVVSEVLAVPPEGPTGPTALPSTGGGNPAALLLWGVLAPALGIAGASALLLGLRRKRAG